MLLGVAGPGETTSRRVRQGGSMHPGRPGSMPAGCIPTLHAQMCLEPKTDPRGTNDGFAHASEAITDWKTYRFVGACPAAVSVKVPQIPLSNSSSQVHSSSHRHTGIPFISQACAWLTWSLVQRGFCGRWSSGYILYLGQSVCRG